MADPTFDDDDAFNAPPSPPAAPVSARPIPSVKAPPPPQQFSDDSDFVAPPAAPAASPTPTYSGTILPFSRYSDGSVGFDPNAGVLGLSKNFAKGAANSIWSGVTLPGDVAYGKVDPNSPEAIRRSLDMATLAAPDAAVMTARRTLTPPTAQDLQGAGAATYNAIRDMGVDRSIPHVSAMAQNEQAGLFHDGISDRLAPTVHAVLNDLQNPPPGAVAVPTSALIAARRELGNIAKDYNNPTQQMAAKRAQSAVDKFIMEPDPQSVISGDALAAGRLFKEANANYAAGARSDAFNQRGDYAEFKANDSNAGQNLPNNLRKQASWILDPKYPARRAGYSAGEIAALEQLNKGTLTTNAARTLGSWLGAGHGVFAGAGIVGAGYEGLQHYGLPGLALGAVPPAIGMAAKSVEKNLTKKAFENVDNLLRSRSPLNEQWQAAAPFEHSANPGVTGSAKAPAIGAVGSVPQPAPEVQQPATPPTEAKRNPKPTPLPKKGPKPPPMTPEEAARYVQQIQPGETFARGGAVKRKSHEELVSRLMDLAEKAKSATKKDTKAILGVHDNAVAKALEVAKKAI